MPKPVVYEKIDKSIKSKDYPPLAPYGISQTLKPPGRSEAQLDGGREGHLKRGINAWGRNEAEIFISKCQNDQEPFFTDHNSSSS
ncbi:hypothetical protein WAI453_010581 [Rhynchosporium graminicola]